MNVNCISVSISFVKIGSSGAKLRGALGAKPQGIL